MTDNQTTENATSALEALDRVLEELRREFAANPEFAARVVRAIGAQVTFDAKDAAKLMNPIELAASKPEADAKAEMASLPAAELKKVAKSFNLATGPDLKGKTSQQLADLLYRRAHLKISERSSS